MKFVTLAPEEAGAALLAHTIRRPGLLIAKGKVLDAESLARLRQAGIDQVTVALIEPGDVPEDRAAERVARPLAGPELSARPAHAGRVNICAVYQGLVLFDPAGIEALNRIDESIAIATLPLRDLVEAGQVVATLKVNPYAAAAATVEAWEAAASPLHVAAFRPMRASLIQTVAPGLKPSVLEKTGRATRDRLEALGSALVADLRAPHEPQALEREIARRVAARDELILICGACSIADRQDVIPAALVAAGGRVAHFGMPVDPGNLLLIGAIHDIPVIGMPGCARTSQLNGFDQVLRMSLAGLPVGGAEIAAMGVGGLLKDGPRCAAARNVEKIFPRIAAIVLAAGQSSRMGENKLALPLDGKPVLAHVVDAIRASRLASITVVTGHQAEEVRALVDGGDVKFVFNPDYPLGMSTSLKAGLAALPADVDGAMIFLGDMPDIDPALIDRLIAAFDPRLLRAIVLPKRGGRRGHPVLWGRGFLPVLMEKLSGDAGARHLIDAHAEWVAEIDAGDDGIFTDLDTPQAFAARKSQIAPDGAANRT